MEYNYKPDYVKGDRIKKIDNGLEGICTEIFKLSTSGIYYTRMSTDNDLLLSAPSILFKKVD